MTRVLLTCPPMIGIYDEMVPVFAERGAELIVPDFVQVVPEQELIELVPQFDAWIIGDDQATAAVLEAGCNGALKACVKWGVGVDNVDFAAAERLGLPITNTPRVFGAEVADLAMHYVSGLARETFGIDRGIREGGWPKPPGISLEGPHRRPGRLRRYRAGNSRPPAGCRIGRPGRRSVFSEPRKPGRQNRRMALSS